MASRTARRLRVVILTCMVPAWECAERLVQEPQIELAAIVWAPMRRPKAIRARIRKAYREHGFVGFLRLLMSKAVARLNWGRRSAPAWPSALAGCEFMQFEDFHSERCIAALTALNADVFVIDGTYILRKEVFQLPSKVTLNLHCGKIPEYRGAPPAFWELFNGEEEVGVTIHGVTEKLDDGPIYAQTTVPIVADGVTDSWAFAQSFWLTTLRPTGLALMAETLRQIAGDRARPQSPSRSTTNPNRRPTAKTIRQLDARLQAANARKEAAARQGS